MRRALIVIVIVLCVSSLASAQTISYFRASGGPNAIASGPDGNLWFTSSEGVGRLTTLGVLTTYPIPSGASSIVPGPNHLMWFVRPGGLGTIDMDGTVAAYDLPYAQPLCLIAGSDNQLWFGYSEGIGRRTTAGAVTLFPLPRQNNRAPEVLALAAGDDGNVWFVEWPFSQVGRITPSGQISEFATTINPTRIIAGPDAGLWLTGNNHIARLSTVGGVTQIFDGPLVGGGGRPTYPNAMTSGPDGRIWFGTETNVLGSVSLAGNLRSIDIPAASYGIRAIAAGSDGNVWATLERIPYSCVTGFCPPQDPTPLAIVRVNLVNPAPVITSMERGFDQTTNEPTVTIRGVGFVPDTVIRWNGIDRTTIYVSPFELSLPAAEASQAAYGGTFVARNGTPGGGDSPAFTLKPASPPRRRATR
jgi:streptogramin lyase